MRLSASEDMRSAINMAWEHRGPDFQSRFDKSTAQAQEMKEEVLRVLITNGDFRFPTSKNTACPLFNL